MIKSPRIADKNMNTILFVLSEISPIISATIGNDTRNPPLYPIIYWKPPVNPAKTGKPIAPNIT